MVIIILLLSTLFLLLLPLSFRMHTHTHIRRHPFLSLLERHFFSYSVQRPLLH
jgi:hypothetical protein